MPSLRMDSIEKKERFKRRGPKCIRIKFASKKNYMFSYCMCPLIPCLVKTLKHGTLKINRLFEILFVPLLCPPQG